MHVVAIAPVYTRGPKVQSGDILKQLGKVGEAFLITKYVYLHLTHVG